MHILIFCPSDTNFCQLFKVYVYIFVFIVLWCYGVEINISIHRVDSLLHIYDSRQDLIPPKPAMKCIQNDLLTGFGFDWITNLVAKR